MAKFIGRTQKRSKRPGRILTRVRLERTPLDTQAIPRVRKTVAEAYWWLSDEAERRVDAIAELLLGADRIDAVEQLFWEADALYRSSFRMASSGSRIPLSASSSRVRLIG